VSAINKKVNLVATIEARKPRAKPKGKEWNGEERKGLGENGKYRGKGLCVLRFSFYTGAHCSKVNI